MSAQSEHNNKHIILTYLDTKNSSFMTLKFVNRRTSSSGTQIATIPHTDRVISRTEISIEILITQIRKELIKENGRIFYTMRN